MAVDEAASPVDLDSEELERLMRSLEGARAALASRIIGQESVIEEVLVGILAEGHVLLEGPPGVGKTLLVKSVAEVLGLEFSRIQFTPDLMPADITGSTVLGYDEAGKPLIRFEPGPIFAQLVLADEVNRATPKAQSALLEAMEEHQVTVDGRTYALPEPFFVIATQNPVEQVGTFPLPESQLDRFLMRIHLGYPDAAHERELLQGEDRRTLLAGLNSALTIDDIEQIQRSVPRVHTAPALLDYLQAITSFTRAGGHFLTGLSPRAAIGLLRASQSWALLEGRRSVLPEDVQAVLPAVVIHRLRATDEHPGPTAAQSVARKIIEAVPIP